MTDFTPISPNFLLGQLRRDATQVVSKTGTNNDTETSITSPPPPQSKRVAVKFDGVCFSPFQPNQSSKSSYPTRDQIRQDLTLVQNNTNMIRTFGVENTLKIVPELCESLGMACYPGIWINGDTIRNNAMVDSLIAIGKKGYSTTRGLIVGSENMYRKDIPESSVISYINRVKSALPDIPVGHAETWSEWDHHPALAAASNILMVNTYPYWENKSVDSAANYTVEKWQYIRQLYPDKDKQVFIGEAGWPSAGETRGQAVASEANEIKFIKDFKQLAEQKGAEYFYFSAFDEPSKASSGNEVEGHWGIYDQLREPKY